MSGERGLNRMRHVLVRALEGALGLAMAVLVLAVVWQVVSRFVLSRPSSWTEELARALMIWVSFLGAAVAYARGGHLGVDYFVNRLAAPSRRVVTVGAHLAVAFFSLLVMVYGGALLVGRVLALGQLTPALGLHVGHLYLPVPIGGGFIALFALEFAWESLHARPGVAEREGVAS
jgi:TRAP-type C4-dicarboxylate transport system permease small subunit